ncbi:MAG: OmpA family protein [Maricaulaceae bacterium]|jgi:outer membrane protein OmpA-like peptidoglycan-associated protein
MKRLASVAIALVLAAGCTTIDPATGRASQTNARTGALTGAVIGGLLGCASNTGECTENAAIGAVAGAAIGGGIGEYMRRQQLALQEELSGTGVGIQREGDNIRLIMPGDVTFSTASSNIDQSFFPVLNDVAAVFVEYPATRVEITGHADSRGDEQYNLELSHQRALSVGNYLISRGVAGNRIYAYGAGENQPIATNDTEVGRARNRRVEILLIPANAM